MTEDELGGRFKSTIRQIDLSLLKIDRSYQRDPSMQLVEEIAYNWDEVASELLLVSDRGETFPDGRYWIVNGQHRSLAATKRGEKKVAARIIDLSEESDPAKIEAGLRLKTNVRLGDRALERFKAQLIAGDEEALAIQKILATFDTEINQVPDMNVGINTVSGMLSLYRVDQGGLLRETLALVKDVYGNIGGKTGTLALFKGYAWFILKHAQQSDRSRLVERLQITGYAALDRRARTINSTMGGSLWLNTYRAIVDFYNEKLQERSRLEWQTRGSGTFRGSPGAFDRGAWGAGGSSTSRGQVGG